MKFAPYGVCSREYDLEIENGIITKLEIVGGCHGNLQGISRLLVGTPAKEAADKMFGVDCRGRGTSCPDQIARAIYAYLENEQQNAAK